MLREGYTYEQAKAVPHSVKMFNLLPRAEQ